MLRISLWLALAAGGATLLAQPALAQATSHRDHRHVAYSDRHRSVSAVVNEVAASPFYGPFGGYPEAAAASHYRGPGERHYYCGSGGNYFFIASWRPRAVARVGAARQTPCKSPKLSLSCDNA
jgi:hypothetical protein